jgi:hypothetical protein
VDTYLGQKPRTNKGTNNPDCDIGDETKSGALNKLSRQPTGNETKPVT